jgi:excisionase family DNA binding protein
MTYTPSDSLGSVSIGEVSRQLGVTPITIRKWERLGKIHAFRTPGGQRRFPVTEIERLRSERAA